MKQTIEPGITVRLRMPVYSLPKGATGKVVDGQNRAWNVQFPGMARPMEIQELCLERVEKISLWEKISNLFKFTR